MYILINKNKYYYYFDDLYQMFKFYLNNLYFGDVDAQYTRGEVISDANFKVEFELKQIDIYKIMNVILFEMRGMIKDLRVWKCFKNVYII